LFKKLFDFFVFTSLFLAGCAVLMVGQTASLFSLELPLTAYVFVFFGSVCSYNFHWYLTPPNIADSSYKLRWNILNRRLHLMLCVIGAVGSAVCCFALIEYWISLCLTAFLTFLYSAPKISVPPFIQLRKIAIGKTIFLAFAWAHITASLPLLISPVSPHPQHVWFVINRFFFIYSICIVFDRRDVDKDREAGIKSLITLLSSKGVDTLFWSSIVMVLLSSVVLLQWLSPAQMVILTVPAFIMGLLYSYAKKSASDYLYYFLLDGLMALSAPILILAKFAP
jgi:4-hydroxybenzoate polyprenyltransferase